MKTMRFLTAVILAFASLVASCSSDDKKVAVTGVELSASSFSLMIGMDSTLVATVKPLDAFDATVEWSSSDETIATVTDGKVSALKIGGPVTITATTRDGGFTATCAVTVVAPSVTGVELSASSLSLVMWEDSTLVATVSPLDAGDATVIWSSSDATIVYVVGGTVSALKIGGPVTITATTHDGGFTATCAVTVVAPPVSGVGLSESSLSLVIGTDHTLTANVIPLEALDTTVEWNSSDATIATVTDGKVSALTLGGPVTITATTRDGGFTATCAVTVIPPPEVIVSTVCGFGGIGTANGTLATARFGIPKGICVDASGMIYVADAANYRIQKIDVVGDDVSTLAGPPPAFFIGLAPNGYVNATGEDARFADPSSLCIDASGNIYVADFINCAIRKITPAGVVTTFAGGDPVSPGYVDGTGTDARFYSPYGVTIDAGGNIYVADYDNYRIRKITPAGVVSTLAGNGLQGLVDGDATTAQLYRPHGIAVDKNGNVYVTDSHAIRKITPTGVVSTLAGGQVAGFLDGTGREALFNTPYGVVVDEDGYLYVTDSNNNRIRKITPSGVVSTLAGTGDTGRNDGVGEMATFDVPSGITLDASGNIYITETAANRIRKITFK